MNARPEALHAPASAEPRPGGADGRPRVVVVGAGFGGLTCVKALAKAPLDVTLIDKRNYHLFQPLLSELLVGGVLSRVSVNPAHERLEP